MNPIKMARENKGITITQLAYLAGVTENTMYRYERKKPEELKKISFEVLEKISQTLDKPISFFVGKC